MSNKKDKVEQLNFKKYLIYFLIFVVISFLTLFYIYNISGKSKDFLIFTDFAPELIVVLFGVLIFYFVCDGLRLYFILKTLGFKVKYRHIFKLVFINLFVSNITPFASGGGIAQVYFLNKRGVPLGNATAATTIRTLLALIFIFITTPIIFIFNNYIYSVFAGQLVFRYLLIFTFLYVVIFYTAIFKKKLVKKIAYLILHFLQKKNIISRSRSYHILKFIFKHINLFSRDFAIFISGNKLYLFLSIFFTIIFLLSEFTFSIIIIKGMGYDLNYILILSMQMVIVFFMYFAPTPGATGVAEGGYSLLFSTFVKKSDVFPLIFSWRLFTKYIGIGIGMILFLIMSVRGENENEK